MDKIIELLSSRSVVVTIVSIMIIAFAKSIISIFNMGVRFKSNLVTRAELNNFETEIRRDMRSYATQIQKAVTDACIRVIDSKLKDIEGAQDAVVEMKVLKTELEAEIKHTLEKYDEIKSVADSVRSLSNKVTKLEYKDSTLTSERRTEK